MLYHLSEDARLKKLTPQIPRIAVEGEEDTSVPRVCFSDFIEGCLSALQDLPKDYYVYTPRIDISKIDIHYPSIQEVKDCKQTHEVWILEEVPVKCLGRIRSLGYDKKTHYSIGFDKRVTFFHYNYEWIWKYKKD